MAFILYSGCEGKMGTYAFNIQASETPNWEKGRIQIDRLQRAHA
jgi:hypothetical protein